MTKKVVILLIVFSLFILPFIVSCQSQKLEPIASDPSLHGQVFRFVKPMIYIESNGGETKEFTEVSINTGRLILPENLSYAYDKKKNRVITKIPDTMNFIIIKSYWVRANWLDRAILGPDHQKLILKDDKGNLSAMLRSSLLNSNKPELAKYERK